MKIKLYKPITISTGETLDELELDFDSLSIADIKNAKKVKTYLGDDQSINVGNVENASVSAGMLSPKFDMNLRIGLAWVAACKTHKGLTIPDILLLSAKDALSLAEESLDYVF